MTDNGATCDSRPEIRDLRPRGWSRLWTLLKRALLLRCPLCGERGIFTHPWSIRECCPACGYRFNREDGYFLGAYALNLVVAEIFGLGAVIVFLLRSDLSVMWQQIIAITAAILFPLLFYPFSRTFWMVIDLMSAGDSTDEYVRGGDLH